MRYLQCSGYITRAEREEQAWMNARAVAECQFDMSGRMLDGGQ